MEQTIRSIKIYQGRSLKLRVDTVDLPNKKYANREIVEHPNAVSIIAKTDDGNYVFVRQYRKAIESDLLELPAGKIERNEDIDMAAHRELKEETGYVANQMDYLGSMYPSPWLSDQIIYVYFASELTLKERDLDEDEYIDVEVLSKEEVEKYLVNNELFDGKTMTSLLYYKNLKGEL
jgi:ADP-ribose pyrophosphatase